MHLRAGVIALCSGRFTKKQRGAASAPTLRISCSRLSAARDSVINAPEAPRFFNRKVSNITCLTFTERTTPRGCIFKDLYTRIVASARARSCKHHISITLVWASQVSGGWVGCLHEHGSPVTSGDPLLTLLYPTLPYSIPLSLYSDP